MRTTRTRINCQSQSKAPLCCRHGWGSIPTSRCNSINIEKMSDIIIKTEPVTVKVGQSSNFVIVTVCVLRELRCVLVEIQNKTKLITVEVGQRRDFVVVTGGKASPLLEVILEQNNLQGVLQELRCVLVEIQNKTKLITVEVGQRRDFVVVTGGKASPLLEVILEQNNLQGVLRELRCVLVEIQNKTKLITVEVGQRRDFVVATGGKASPLLETGPVTVKVSQRPHFVAVTEGVLQELRCVLVEIQNKTKLITVEVGQRRDFVVVTGGKASPLLEVILEQNNLQGVLRELRCVLVEIQNKTKLITVEVGQRRDFVVVTGGKASPLLETGPVTVKVSQRPHFVAVTGGEASPLLDTGPVTVKVSQRPHFVAITGGEASPLLDTGPVTVKVSQRPHFVAVTEGVLQELRCVLVEIQNKTKLITVEVGQRRDFVVVTGGKASPLLEVILEQNNLQGVLRELRCVLVEIQNKTKLITVEVGQRRDFVVVTGGKASLLLETGPVTVKVSQRPHFVAVTGGEASPLLDTGPVTVKVSQRPHFVAVTVCVLREVGCALVEMQTKTGPVTVKVSQRPHFVAVTGGEASPLLDNIERMICVLRELRCVLVEIQNKTKLITVEVGQRRDFIAVTELRCVLVEIQNKTKLITVEVGQRHDFVVISRSQLSPLLDLILQQIKIYIVLKKRGTEIKVNTSRIIVKVNNKL
ncbi:hypothetical protein V1477_008935 [Vespula maculifrons]|uniref:Uncharacterized protein n=1 Tax=Vespula maculifrons TaxID=7453 RepID=A0ABD2CEG2_VESMC